MNIHKYKRTNCAMSNRKPVDYAICPMCHRDRAEVARTVGAEYDGYQVAVGKRTACVECGPKVLASRRTKFAWRELDRQDIVGASYRRKVKSIHILNDTLARLQRQIADAEHDLALARRDGRVRRLLRWLLNF